MSDYPQFMTYQDAEANQANIDSATLRNRIDAMKARQMFQQMKRQDAWRAMENDPRGPFDPVAGQFMPRAGAPVAQPAVSGQAVSPAPAGPMAVTPQAQTAPQLSDDDRAVIRGQKKMAAMTQRIQPLVNQAKTDPSTRERINKMSEMMQNDPDQQALVSRLGFDEMSYSVDPESGEEKHVLTKNWSKEELEKYAENAPNGQTLLPFAKYPGKYKITFNGAGAVTGIDLVKNDMNVDKLSPEVRLIYSSLKQKLGRNPTPSEVYDEERRTKVEDAKAMGENRYAPLLAGRGGNYLDTKTGKIGFVNVNKLNSDDEGRYIGTQDPNFKAWTKNVEYERANSNFVNTIDRYSSLANQIMTKYGLNKGTKFENYTLQDVIKLQGMGSGDVAALNQVLMGLKQEIAKVESGSLGIAGAHVETAKQFDKSINLNMPASDLRTVFEWAKKAGRERLAAIKEETGNLKAGAMGKESSVEPSGNDPLGLR